MRDDPAVLFDRLVARYHQAWFRFHPEAALDCGVSGFEHLLAPHDDDDHGAEVALTEKLLLGLEEIDPAQLDPDRTLDHQLLTGAAVIAHHELLRLDWRHRDPVRFLPVQALYQLTVRPVEHPVAALKARLEAIPAHLRGARAKLGATPELIPPLWLESALAEARGGAHFVRRLHEAPRIAARPRVAELRSVQEAAATALLEFANFLEAQLAPRAQGEFAIGREHFERLLAQRHFLDVGSAALRRFGERLFERTFDELRAVTRELRGDQDVRALTERLREDHSGADELLDTYREQMRAARAFVEQHQLVSMPRKQRLAVVETPLFLRHRIPFAAYFCPMPGDEEQRGLYYVTPAEDEQMLGEHNRLGLMHTCVHEAWPGHHLQFVTANAHAAASSLPRLLNRSSTLYEGWALYCEQLMHEEGFLDRPEQRFVLLRDRLWRALRVVLDVDLQAGGLRIEGAADRMERALGFPRAQALADLSWYSRSPAVPMGYATGWALINGLRKHHRDADPAAFDLRNFHDRLLAAGSVALPLVIRRRFGDAAWAAARGGVFGGNGA